MHADTGAGPERHLPDAPRPLLGLREAVTLIVGIVVGAGIFKAPAAVAGMTGSAGWMFLAWTLGGALSLVGALCYAELATSYAHAGGDYHFLHRAYGRSLAFLFGWARYAVITTGSIALLAFVFGDYVQQSLPLGSLPARIGATVYAAGAVLVLALVNLRGLRSGTSTQNWLTVVEVGGLLLLVATAIWLAAGAPPAASPTAAGSSALTSATGPPAFGLAMVFVLLTYGGWNEAAYISAEIHDPSRNILRALVLSVALVTVLYLLVCWAYWHVLGMRGLAASAAPAADLLRRGLGAPGERGIALLVAVSALTSINATMIVGARTGYALGRDWPRLAWLARWNGARAAPSTAMVAQCAAALLLVAAAGRGGDGFRAMVEFTSPVFWLFFLLTGIALFILRRRDPGRPPALPRTAVPTAAAAVLRQLRLHAVVQPGLRLQPFAGRHERGLDRRRRARRRCPAAARGARRYRAPTRFVDLCTETKGQAPMKPSLSRRGFLLSAASATGLPLLPFLPAAAQSGTQPQLDVPFVPTPQDVVDRMLTLAKVGSNDLLYDLGCGDGRIVVTAARAYRTRGVGFDLNPERIAEAKANAHKAGVDKLASFQLANLFETDLSPASVVTLYLLPTVNVKLRPRLWQQLKVGSRVVSHAFDMGPEWPPEQTVNLSGRTIYLWTITPAQKAASPGGTAKA